MTAILVLSKLSHKKYMHPAPDTHVYCPVRREWVFATPEEVVRQKLIKEMVEQKGYPLSGLAVEKALSQMPHLQNTKGLPTRRADIVCFVKAAVGLVPLLLVECKAEPWTKKAENQILGYNYFLRARFVALADANKVKTGTFDTSTNEYLFVEDLPHINHLI